MLNPLFKSVLHFLGGIQNKLRDRVPFVNYFLIPRNVFNISNLNLRAKRDLLGWKIAILSDINETNNVKSLNIRRINSKHLKG